MKKPKFTRRKQDEPQGTCGGFRMEFMVTCAETGESEPMTLTTTSRSMYRKHVKYQKLRKRFESKSIAPTTKTG
jgi:hypothetical protein